MRHSTPYLSLLLTASLILTACGKPGDADSASGGSSSRPAQEVGYITVREKPFTVVNELPGRTTSQQVAEVRPQVTGILTKRLFTEGDTVEAGQPLYQIDDKLYKADLASARADLAAAEADRESAQLTTDRYQNLIKTGAVSQQELDDARAKLNAAKASVAAAQAAIQTAQINLDYTVIKAPISGRIGRSNVTAGALVTANQSTALTVIRQLDPIYVDLTQSYDDLQALRDALDSGKLKTVGKDEAAVSLVQKNGKRYEYDGTLQFSEYAVDENTGSVTLRALFPNPDDELLPGMFVRARLPQAETPNAILVPQKAVSRESSGQATALVINQDNKIEKRELEAERAVGNRWLIGSGLKDGDRLVVDGLQKVREGDTVKPVSVDDDSDEPDTAADSASEKTDQQRG